MATLVEGGILNFTVVARNKFGTIVPVGDAAVSLDNTSLGTVEVSADGSAGKFTAAVGTTGDVTLVPSAAGVTGSAFLVSITADTAVVSVEIVVDDAVASVELVPA